MHSTIKKLGAILLALTLLFALSATAFAAGEEELGQDKSVVDGTTVISDAGAKQDYSGSPASYQALGNTVRIDKEIIIFNTRSDDTIVYLPNVKFTYSIAAANVTDGTPTIKDENSNSAKVKDGVAAALSTTTAYVQYSNTAGISNNGGSISAATYVTTNEDGVAAAGYFDITFTPANFGSAGIYRYVITEAQDSTLTRAKAGVTNSNYTATRYLDVYVRNAAGTGLEIYGYVLFEDSSVDKSFDASVAGNLPLTAKTNGFVSDYNDDGTTAYDPTEDDVDIYETSNVKVQKVIAGALGDKNHEFPFAVTIANSTITSDPIISYQVLNDPANAAALHTENVNSTATMSSGTVTIGAATASGTIKLDDQDYIYIYGIPGKNQASTVNTSEYNDTYDIYTVTAKYDNTATNVKDTNETSAASVSMENTQVAELAAAQTVNIAMTENVVEVTNTLNEVSPTGVVLRVAPYALMLGAGFIFLAISKRRKEESEA